MQVSFPLSKIKHEQNKNFKNGQSISDLWDHFKRPNIGIGVLRREQIRAGEKKKEYNCWKFPKYDENYGFKRFNESPSKIYMKESTSKYVTTKFLSTHAKEKILNVARDKRHIMYRRIQIRIIEKPLVTSKASERIVEQYL